ncbi:MAG: helix-turn-helix domain-containing protein [Gemmatirosa sp.]|nr:helix-turn-helix domain-containing protein [Gemmatirosa sp.]
MPAAIAEFSVDAYVVDVLLPDLVGHDRHPSAFLTYVALWRRTRGGAEPATLSLRELSEATGLSKRAVQDAVDALVRRRLVSLARDTPTSVPAYSVLRPWGVATPLTRR